MADFFDATSAPPRSQPARTLERIRDIVGVHSSSSLDPALQHRHALRGRSRRNVIDASVEPIIDLAPGAADNPLAVELVEQVRRNVAGSSKKTHDFRTLRGSVLIVAQDTQSVLTMRFDHGRLTVHEGAVGIPSVTLCGDEQVLRGLTQLHLSTWLRLPKVISRTTQTDKGAVLWDFARAMTEQRLTVYGLFTHPRLVLCFLRVVSGAP
jgi:hypothetical protein